MPKEIKNRGDTRTVKEKKVYKYINITAKMKIAEDITREDILADPMKFISELCAGHEHYRYNTNLPQNGIFDNVCATIGFEFDLHRMLSKEPQNFQIHIVEATDYWVEDSMADAETNLKKMKEKGFVIDSDIVTSKYGDVIVFARVKRFILVGKVWTGEWEKA